MKKILGLDLGTNSIGWALVEIDHENRIVRILGLGSRILQMDAGEISKFESGGKLESSAAHRTTDRTIRKSNERFLLRRDRLHCILNLLQTLPEHYKVMIDFVNEKGYRSGKFKRGKEVKLAYTKNSQGKSHFLFMDAYKEMESEFKNAWPELFYKKRNGNVTQIPFDWTLYYLRRKALTQEITKEELAWIILSFNQKRGYTKTIGEDEKIQKEGELTETFIAKVNSVEEVGVKDGLKVFDVILESVSSSEMYHFYEESLIQITFANDLKNIEKISKLNEDASIDELNTKYIISEIRKMKVIDVLNTKDEKDNNKKVKDNFVFDIKLETGWIKEQQSRYAPKWIGIERDFIIKTTYDINGKRIEKGSDKGRNINAPKEEDWTLVKLKTETTISSFNAKNKTFGLASFIYSELLKNPSQKIKGSLVTVVERKYYKEELDKILECQKRFHKELIDVNLYKKAVNLLYPNNENHRRKLESFSSTKNSSDSFTKLISDDILMYQRDLKSKKSLIADCVYEKENFLKINKKTGESYKDPLKAIHKANPLYQEFRLWQFIKRLKIIDLVGKEVNGEVYINKDVSENLLTIEIKEKLFEALNDKESITQKQFFEVYNKIKGFKKNDINKLAPETHKWNFVVYTDEQKKTEHKEPCNETRYSFIVRLKRIKDFDWNLFLTKENEYRLWHFFYSVKNQNEFKAGLKTLIENLLIGSKLSLDFKELLIQNFITFEGFRNDYGTYSERALKKLLPFLRLGKYWNKIEIEQILLDIQKYIEFEDKSNKLNIEDSELKRKKVLNTVITKEGINGEIKDFQGLWISSACYIVYNRYSEVGDLQYWHSPDDIDNYIKNDFKQHSLNNPVVEKVLIETLQLVKEIWKYYGTQDCEMNYEKLFDAIHIELGREMKKNAKERERESKKNSENKASNERIATILKEIIGEDKAKSPFQLQKLRILEEDLLTSIQFDKDNTCYSIVNGNITKKEIRDITNKDFSNVSKNDMMRYKLWLDQRYQSPYTGKVIKLTDLFDREKYEIEHVFPKERITLNAMSNLVIAETEVNKEKKAKTGYQFILDCNGKRKIKCAAHNNQEVEIKSPEEYETLVKTNFKDKKKQEILLSKDIPDDFTNSQLNNARFISKMAMKLLSNIVREEGEDSYRSKNVLPVNGAITNTLKRDWQLNDTWNELIQPRFERLNKITNSKLFGDFREIDGHLVFDNKVPEELANNFDKKRIDHRHHALDALIIALTTENHVNYLNNISSKEDKTDKLQQRTKLKNILTDKKKNRQEDETGTRFFLPPAQEKRGGTITEYKYIFKKKESKSVFKHVALEALQNTIVSFKQKARVIKQRTNKYQLWSEENGKLEMVSEKGLKLKEKFNVKQKLHLATFYGNVKLQQKTVLKPLTVAVSCIDKIVSKELRDKIIMLKDNKSIKHDEIITLLKSQFPTVEIYEDFVATRYENTIVSLGSLDSNKIIGAIESITDLSIQNILKNHLEKYNSILIPIDNAAKYIEQIVDSEHKLNIAEQIKENLSLEHISIDNKQVFETQVFTKLLKLTDKEKERQILNPQIAFSFEGVEEMNNNIQSLNNGKNHQPIFKVRMFTALGTKFPVSDEGQKSKKIVVTAGDSNLFCGFYENSNGERKFQIPTLKESVESLKQGLAPNVTSILDTKTNETYYLKFVLMPKDFVFVPTMEENDNPSLVDLENLTKEQKTRIYKFRDGSINSQGEAQMNFMPASWANMIFKESKISPKIKVIENKDLKGEITITSDKDKSQNSLDGVQIKSCCWKLEIDRLGNIKKCIRPDMNVVDKL